MHSDIANMCCLIITHWLYIAFRAEQLKPQVKTSKPSSTGINDPILMMGDKVVPPLGFGAFADSDDEDKKSDGVGPARIPTIPQKHVVNTGPSGYTKDEIEVLR